MFADKIMNKYGVSDVIAIIQSSYGDDANLSKKWDELNQSGGWTGLGRAGLSTVVMVV